MLLCPKNDQGCIFATDEKYFSHNLLELSIGKCSIFQIFGPFAYTSKQKTSNESHHFLFDGKSPGDRKYA